MVDAWKQNRPRRDGRRAGDGRPRLGAGLRADPHRGASATSPTRRPASFRNDIRGQWRYYRLAKQMTPKTIDWDLFLGHQFECRRPAGRADAAGSAVRPRRVRPVAVLRGRSAAGRSPTCSRTS